MTIARVMGVSHLTWASSPGLRFALGSRSRAEAQAEPRPGEQTISPAKESNCEASFLLGFSTRFKGATRGLLWLGQFPVEWWIFFGGWFFYQQRVVVGDELGDRDLFVRGALHRGVRS